VMQKVEVAITDATEVLAEAFDGDRSARPTGRLMQLAKQCDKVCQELRAANSAWEPESAEAWQLRVVRLEKLLERMTATIKAIRSAKDERAGSK